MAVINDPNTSTNVAAVGEKATGATGALHVTTKPLPASVGHYRVNHRFVMVNTQAANSRLFVIRNPHATNLLVMTRLVIKWVTASAHTALIEDSIDVYKLTGFSVLDTTNTVTLTPSLKRTSMAATNMQVRGCTVAGIAAGMTGATSTKDGSSIGQLARFLPQTVEATTETVARDTAVLDVFSDDFASHPFVLVQNEGILVENRVVLGAAAGSSVYIDCSYAEVTAY